MTDQRIQSPIVGAKYHRGAQVALDQMPDDAAVLLVRQPQNQFDRNAVAVFGLGSWRGQQLGYVLAEVAKTLGPIMDVRGLTEIEARFDKLDGRKSYVSILFERTK